MYVMAKDPKLEKALEHATENGEALRIEYKGQPVVTYNAKGQLRVHSADAASLKMAATLIAQAMNDYNQQVSAIEARVALLSMALGAVASRHVEASEAEAAEHADVVRRLTPGEGSVTFAQAAPKGKAS